MSGCHSLFARTPPGGKRCRRAQARRNLGGEYHGPPAGLIYRGLCPLRHPRRSGLEVFARMTPPNLQRHALHGPPAGGWINRTHTFCTTRTPQGLFWCQTACFCGIRTPQGLFWCPTVCFCSIRTRQGLFWCPTVCFCSIRTRLGRFWCPRPE